MTVSHKICNPGVLITAENFGTSEKEKHKDVNNNVDLNSNFCQTWLIAPVLNVSDSFKLLSLSSSSSLYVYSDDAAKTAFR
mgnify:CR=1 FL=1